MGKIYEPGLSATGRLVHRVPRIVFAYITASFLGGASLGFLNLITNPPPMGQTFALALAKALAIGGFLFGAFTAIYAAVPAIVLIVLGECFGWRRWWVYVAASAVLGVVTDTLLDKGNFNIKTALIFAAAGAFAGFIYWLIAGQSAGLRAREAA